MRVGISGAAREGQDRAASADNGKPPESDRRVMVFALAGALVLLAAVSFLFIPRGTGVKACNSTLVLQNRYSCIESLAISEGNGTMCSLLQEPYADNCYQTIAMNTSNAVMCGYISSNGTAAACYSYIGESRDNASICGQIRGNATSAGACIYHVAAVTEDAGLCSIISGHNKALSCYSTVYLEKAVYSSNLTACAYIASNNDTNITEYALQNANLSRFPGVDANITTYLEKTAFLNATLGARDACYMSLAFSTGNSIYCGYTQGRNLSASCRLAFSQKSKANTNAISTANFTALLGMCSGQSNQTQCTDGVLYLEAVETRNVSICGKLSQADTYGHYQCYYAMAKEYNNTRYCSYITNSTLNSDCVLAVEGAFNVNSTGA